MWSRRLMNAIILRPLAWVLIRAEVIGRERIPADGSFILMVNHCNFLDPGVAMWAMLPRQVVLFTKAKNLDLPVGGPLLRWYGVIPVERGEADTNAMRQAFDLLKENRHILLVAPEGTRSYHGRLLSAKDGMAFMATRADVPILPVGVSGVKTFWANVRRVRRTRVQVVIGHPFRFRGNERSRRDSLRRMTREAMYQLAALLPPEQWGEYADIENASEETIEFLEPGQSNLVYAQAASLRATRAHRGRLVGALE
ncbi:MAG: 1-acyl-sn-glycerol-3-phosphate acyltransferase [Anaerolineae bacterium]|nr:1-acyl-sn-glycerol-3-phosphate acyltransferase [Anaerolineae bacterium]